MSLLSWLFGILLKWIRNHQVLIFNSIFPGQILIFFQFDLPAITVQPWAFSWASSFKFWLKSAPHPFWPDSSAGCSRLVWKLPKGSSAGFCSSGCPGFGHGKWYRNHIRDSKQKPANASNWLEEQGSRLGLARRVILREREIWSNLEAGKSVYQGQYVNIF